MSPRPVAEHELTRILALVPYVVTHPGRTRAELARRFGVSESQLDDDLRLVLMVGVPPYSPGDYVTVDEDDEGRVRILLADVFLRPLRLNPAEGIALLAAGRVLLAVPGSDPEGPLATALAKLETALGAPGPVVEVGEPEHLTELRAAAAGGRRVEIEYFAAGRDELTTRRVDPWGVTFLRGEWYLHAYCHRAGAERLFRVDRVRALRDTGETFAVSERPPPGEVYRARPGDPRVRLRLSPSASWVADLLPLEEHDEERGEVVLAATEPAWLERLLLRLGPDAEVVEPAEWRDRAAAAARRVLARYGDATAGSAGHDTMRG